VYAKEDNREEELTQCTLSDSLEETVGKNFLGDLAELDEEQDTDDNQPVIHARIRLCAVKVAETAAAEVSGRMGMSLSTPEIFLEASGPHVLESSTNTEEHDSQSPVRHSDGIPGVCPAAEQSSAQRSVDSNIGEEEASSRVPTPRVEPPGPECEHQEPGNVPGGSAVRQHNHENVHSVGLQVDCTGHPKRPTRESQVTHLQRVIPSHPQQIPDTVETSQCRIGSLGSTEVRVSIQSGKVFEVLCVDCAEDDAGQSKADGKRDTHADGAGNQGAGVGCGRDIAEEGDGDCAGGQQDEEAEDEGLIPEKGREDLAEEHLVVGGCLGEVWDVT
jgi:hypothetical protein